MVVFSGMHLFHCLPEGFSDFLRYLQSYLIPHLEMDDLPLNDIMPQSSRLRRIRVRP